jgi:hypothetical protein
MKMNIDDTIEIFASTIILAIGGVIVVSIYAPDFGDILQDILPAAIKLVLYLMLTFILVVLVKDIIDNLQ